MTHRGLTVGGLLLALGLLGPAPIEAIEERGQATLRGIPGSVDPFADGQTLVVFAHQDDDLLWMLPFWPAASRFLLSAYPATPLFEDLVESFPPELKYRERWTPIWATVDDDIWADVFTDRCKRAPIVNRATITAHLRPFVAAPIRRVVTHNNWGEYGHAQHRLVNMAVRQLASERGLDVWALGTRMPQEATEQSEYVDVASALGLPTIEGYFDPTLFRTLRGLYLAQKPRASTPELTAAFLNWRQTLWTWSDKPDAFPMGWRPFVKLVDKGVDLTVGNAAVAKLETDLPIVNDCPTNPTLPSH
jgi:hypothetical protein